MPLHFLTPAHKQSYASKSLCLALLLTVGSLAANAQTVSAPIQLRNPQGKLEQADVAWRAPHAAHMQFMVQGKYKSLPYKTKAQLSWLPQGQRYEAAQEVQIPIVGVRRQSSVGSLSANGLLPEIFMDRGRKESSATFDNRNAQILFSRGKDPYPLVRGTQDRISVFFQVAGMVLANPQRYPQGTQIIVQAASTSRVAPWTFTVRGTEALQLPAGRISALKLEHSSESGLADGMRSAVWLAPSLEYLPVRIRILEDDGRDELDLRLQSHTKP